MCMRVPLGPLHPNPVSALGLPAGAGITLPVDLLSGAYLVKKCVYVTCMLCVHAILILFQIQQYDMDSLYTPGRTH